MNTVKPKRLSSKLYQRQLIQIITTCLNQLSWFCINENNIIVPNFWDNPRTIWLFCTHVRIIFTRANAQYLMIIPISATEFSKSFDKWVLQKGVEKNNVRVRENSLIILLCCVRAGVVSMKKLPKTIRTCVYYLTRKKKYMHLGSYHYERTFIRLFADHEHISRSLVL